MIFTNLIKQKNGKKFLHIDNTYINYEVKLEKNKKIIKYIIFNNIKFNCQINIKKIFPIQLQCINDGNSKIYKYTVDDIINSIDTIYIFDNCIFHEDTVLSDKNIIFKNCKFNKAINADYKSKFYNCEFKEIKKPINILGGKINILEIKNQTFNEKFYINRQDEDNDKTVEIETLEICQTTFKDKFKLHNCKIKKLSIKDTDFEKDADFFKCEFSQNIDEKDKNIYFKNINFNDLVIFDEAVFKEKVYFNYVTFNGYVNFRKATFEKGLDLELANIKNDINFYGIDIKDISNISQETYRVIKYQFEKIGNKINSNTYHILELNKNRQNIWNKEEINFDLFQRGIVSLLHFITSKHSQSWILPLFWIFLIGIITENIVSNMGFKISFDYLNHTIQYMSLLTPKDMFCGNNIVFIFNKISLGYLYYQFLTAVRKDTRK